MNKRRFIIETISFCAIWIVFFIASFLTLYFNSKSEANEVLLSNLNSAESLFDGNDMDFTNLDKAYKDSNIRISITQKESDGSYEIIYDSKGLTKESLYGEEFDSDKLGQMILRTSAYNEKYLYIAIKDRENPHYYVRAAIQQSYAMSASFNFLIYGSIAFIILDSIYVIYRYREYKNTIRPLSKQIKNLASLANYDVSFKDDLLALTKVSDAISTALNNQLQAYKSEKEKSDEILKSISQGYIVLNQEREIVLFNPEAEKIFEKEEKEVINSNIYSLLGGNKFNGEINSFLASTKTSTSFYFNLNNRIYNADVYKTNKKTTIIVLNDVTEKRNAEKMKADFFSNASHELKSPLTAILGYQQLIEQEVVTSREDILDLVSRSEKEAQRMASLINDMLTITRLEDQMQKQIEKFNIIEILFNSIETCKINARQKNITIAAKINGNLIVNAQKIDIQMLFNNILENAVKYNKEGGTIEIRFNKNKNTVTIKDSGIGIEKQNIPHIFERFYRVDNSRVKTNVQGTGLGLSIVKHICQNYNIDISVDSVFGSYTEFKLDFTNLKDK